MAKKRHAAQAAGPRPRRGLRSTTTSQRSASGQQYLAEMAEIDCKVSAEAIKKDIPTLKQESQRGKCSPKAAYKDSHRQDERPQPVTWPRSPTIAPMELVRISLGCWAELGTSYITLFNFLNPNNMVHTGINQDAWALEVPFCQVNSLSQLLRNVETKTVQFIKHLEMAMEGYLHQTNTEEQYDGDDAEDDLFPNSSTPKTTTSTKRSRNIEFRPMAHRVTKTPKAKLHTIASRRTD